MAKVLSMKDNIYYGHFKGKKSFEEVKAIKEQQEEVLCYKLTDVESQKLDDGWTPTIVNEIVNLTAPTEAWLNAYKVDKKQEQKQKVKKIFKDNEFDASDSEIYKTSIKNYYINIVKQGINNAIDKKAVDDFIETIDYPQS